MEKIKLSLAAKAMNGRLCAPDGEFSSVCIDSRALTEGCLFIAIKGDNFDGHSFAADALEKGAAAVVCSREVEGCGRYILVEDTRRALLDLSAFYRMMFDIPVVGLTGSVGKTTTKDMVACVLSSKYKTLSTEKNLNNEIGLPQMIFRLDSSYEAAVFEMGMNHAGEISRLADAARPTVGLITNVGVSHIENLGSREGILAAKLEIIDKMDDDAPLLLNADNDMLSMAAKRLERKIYTFAIDSEADMRASDLREDENGNSFTVRYKDEEQRFTLSVLGRHNVYNAMAAALCGEMLGISLARSAEALSAYEHDGRRQNVVDVNGVTVIEDWYNASPDSIKASLSVLGRISKPGHKSVAVLGGMLELGCYAPQLHRECGEAAKKMGADAVFAYGPNAEFYVEGAQGIDARLFDDKKELARELADYISEGDCLLIKGSRGMRMEEAAAELYRLLGKE